MAFFNHNSYLIIKVFYLSINYGLFNIWELLQLVGQSCVLVTLRLWVLAQVAWRRAPKQLSSLLWLPPQREAIKCKTTCILNILGAKLKYYLIKNHDSYLLCRGRSWWRKRTAISTFKKLSCREIWQKKTRPKKRKKKRRSIKCGVFGSESWTVLQQSWKRSWHDPEWSR